LAVRQHVPASVRPFVRAVLPARRRAAIRAAFRRRIQIALLGSDLAGRMESLETRMLESREQLWERSRVRWRATKPTTGLTWGIELDGGPFVSKAAEHGAVGPTRRVLEVGPGYGRLLAACLERGDSFSSYVGVDLSEDNVRHLRERFSQDNITFVNADVETVEVDEPVDAVISSLTFKHLFPSFEAALTNLSGQLRPGGVVAFDLIEGRRRYFQDDGVTYIRWYARDEIESILAATGLDLVTFDEVRHLPDLTRLLVVARKPG
jgi:SAM-dependent methyltransferase